MKAWWLCLALAVAGCAGGMEGQAPLQPLPEPGTLVVVAPHQDKLPFDPRSARLAQATGQLTALVGHPVVLELDAALLPEYTVSFEQELIASIENATRDLTELRKASARVFERSAARLDRIACRYRATAHSAQAVFDPSLRAIVITEPAQATLVPRGLVLRALEDEFESYLDRQYRTMLPEQVPPAERGAYFEYLTMTRPGYGTLWERPARKALADRSRQEKLANDPHAETILRVARLAELARGTDSALSSQTRDWLVEQASWLDNQHSFRPEVSAIRADSLLARSEQAWVRWLSANIESLPDSDRVSMARVLFPGRGRCPQGDPCSDQPSSFAGFDRVGFGFAVVDQWRAEGRNAQGEGPHFELQDQIVCPHTRGQDGRRTRNRSCTAAFYQQAMATEASRARLVRELVRRGDGVLVDEVFTNSGLTPSERVVATWRALEPHQREWQAATRAITEHLLPEREHSEAIVQEAKRLWRDAPRLRGAALLILTETTRGLDRHYSDPRWAGFARDYGEPISRQVFEGFLDQGPRAIQLAPMLWPALGPGFSRAEPIVARLDRFMDEPGVRAGRDGEPGKTLRAIAGRLCDESAQQDLSRLHGWVQQRARSHPQEAPGLAALIADTETCRKPANDARARLGP